jgi:hypothetical protein
MGNTQNIVSSLFYLPLCLAEEGGAADIHSYWGIVSAYQIRYQVMSNLLQVRMQLITNIYKLQLDVRF